MRCNGPNLSFSLTANILANDLELCEYQPTVNGRYMQCWVPVATGQVVSVSCNLGMAAVVHHVDFLVDGVIRDTWISRKNQQYANLVFAQAYFRQKKTLVRGTMRTSDIGADGYIGSSASALGSIELRVFRPDIWGQLIRTPPPALTAAMFRRSSTSTPVYPQPTHHIEFGQINGLTPHQKATFRAKLRQSRSGTAPWASLTFLYRSHESLQAAGFLRSLGSLGSLSPTRATTPFTPEPSLNYRKSSSVVKNTSDNKLELPDLKDFPLPPTIEAFESTSPIVARSFAAPESVFPPSIEFDIENVVKADSEILNRDISRHRNLSSRESLNPQPFTPAISELSLGPLLIGLEHPQRRPSRPLFLTPHPEERRSQQATDHSLWRTMAVHQGESAPPKEQQPQHKGSKRAYVDVKNASPESVSSPLGDDRQAAPKRRKKDVVTMRVKVVELQKKRDEAKRAREEAKKKAEEHQSESFKSSGPASQGYSRRWNVRLRKILWLQRHTWNAKSLTKVILK